MEAHSREAHNREQTGRKAGTKNPECDSSVTKRVI